MKLLIVEDEAAMREALAQGFAYIGYAVDTAADGEEALECYYGAQYDAILLDLNLPKLDGIEVLRAIRDDDPLARVLILSARNEVEDRIAGLDVGANDYLGKPFHFGELQARVRALVRRDLPAQSAALCCGDITIDLARARVCCGDAVVGLTPKEYGILVHLFYNKGQIVTAEALLEHTSNGDVSELSGGSVKVHINALRRKLPTLGIHTVRGQGYYVE